MRATLATLALTACTFRVPVDPLELSLSSLQLGETDFVELVRAVDAVRFRGRATLREGRYPLDSRDYEALEITGPTRATFEADVALRQADARGLRLVISPDVREFRVAFDRPVVLHGRGGGRRVTLEGAALGPESPEGQRFTVGVRVGRSLMGSIAGAVVGVPGGVMETDALDAIARVEVSELTTTLRAGSTIRHGESTLVVAEPSGAVLRRLDVDVEARTARFELEAALDLGPGTCVVTAEGRLCSDAVRLELHGEYSRAADTERLRLSELDRPTRLVARGGQLDRRTEAGAFEPLMALERAELTLDRYECAGALTGASAEDAERSRCSSRVRADLDGAAGALSVEGRRLRFDGLRVRDVRLEQNPDESSMRVGGVSLRGPVLELDSASGATEVRFSEVVLGEVQGERWGSAALLAGSLIARAGEVSFTFAEPTEGAPRRTLRGTLAGETRIDLGQREALRVALASEGRVEGTMRLRAELDELAISLDDVVVARARGLELDALVGGSEDRLELRAREAVRVDTGALSDVAMGDLRLGFRALRLVRDAQQTRFETDGLRLSLPRAQVLAALRPRIPPSFVSDDKPLTGAVVTSLGAIASASRLQNLSRFRARLEVAGLDALDAGLDRGRLRVRGEVDATVRLMADESRVRVDACVDRVTTTVPVPCLRGGMPALCDRTFEADVPYPCVATETAAANVLAGTFRVALDLTGELRSNAPAPLSELALQARVVRCDRVDLRGMNDALERALDVEGTLCRELRGLERVLPLGDVLDVEQIPVLRGAHVRRLDLDSDEADVHVALDLSIAL
ncbi:MAG: hypothetical protein KF901_00775 [Myxococcales bacterium]|nr:hypothetical protein [Myxococcales bacterium]